MWRRVGGTTACATCLLLACGKSEQGMPASPADNAGSSTGGVMSASSGTGNSAGSAVSAGGAVPQAGNATTGGDAPNVGGRAEAGTAAGGEASAGEASVDGGGAASCSDGYRACGCGCCGGQTPPVMCVYPELDDDLAKIIAADVARRNDLQGCAAAGCSVGVDYVCCESPAPSAEQATYTTSVFIGDISRLSIDKMSVPSGTDCSTLTLRQDVPGDPAVSGFALETPAGWEIERATRLGCISSAARPRAIGGIGKLSLRVVGNACVADVHLTLFFGDAAQGVDAERFDADALPINVSVAECH